MQKFKSVDQLVNQLKPVEPTYCIRKNSIQLASKFFQKKFPGKVLYAVKTNPHPIVLKTLIESGIESFDVASIKEIKTIKKKDISLDGVAKFDEIILVGSGKGVISVNSIDKPYWRRKSLKTYRFLSKIYQQAVTNCPLYNG